MTAPRVCPTCKKPNCGNWAACARRAETTQPLRARERSRPPYALDELGTMMWLGGVLEQYRRRESWRFWVVVGKVEYAVQTAVGADVVAHLAATDPKRLGELRWEVATMIEEEMRKRAEGRR